MDFVSATGKKGIVLSVGNQMQLETAIANEQSRSWATVFSHLWVIDFTYLKEIIYV